MKNILIPFLTLVFTTGFAKEKLPNPFEEKQDITSQFDYIYKKSYKHKEYKVIKISFFNLLKSSVLDSIQSQKNIISQKGNTIIDNNNKISSLQAELSNTQNQLKETILLKDTRSVLGVTTNKATFSTTLTISYIVLIAMLGFFIFKYLRNLATTQNSIEDLSNLELEFENHKKQSLKRFQEVNRKLQDELNKNWKKEK